MEGDKDPSKTDLPEVDGIISPQYEDVITNIHKRLSEYSSISNDAKDIINTMLESLLESKGLLSENSSKVIGALIETNNYITITNQDERSKKELTKYLDELCKVKDDKQQRSWPIYADENVIISYINRVIEIMEEHHHHEMIKTVLLQTRDDYVDMLVKYYQMESRSGIRRRMLILFLYMSSIHEDILNTLVNTILVMELCREINTTRSEVGQFLFASKLLTILLSTSTKLPQDHYFHLTEEFFQHVLQMIEGAGDTSSDCWWEGSEDELISHLIYILIMFNYNHSEVEGSSSPVIVRCLVKQEQAKTLTHQLIYMLNEEDDVYTELVPIMPTYAMVSSEESILRLLEDMFTSEEVAEYFYTNDVMVLIGVVNRKLLDLSCGDKRRSQYLSLLYQVIGNHPQYPEHLYQNKETNEVLHNVIDEEELVVDGREQQEEDKYIAKSMLQTYSTYFY